ncbi:hypothetical protein LguiB_019624 [Lonicera macranthoides]
MDSGDLEFKFDRLGPFYFISGNKANCNKVRNRPNPPHSPAPIRPTLVVALHQGFTLLPSLTAVAPTPIASSPAITLELSPMSLSPASEASILASSLLPMSPSPTSGASVSTPALSPMSPISGK